MITLPGVAQAQLLAFDDIFGVPVAQQLVVEAPGAKVVTGQVTTTPWLSVTITLDNSTLVLLVTTYSQVTALPTAIDGPGAASAS